MPRSSDGLYSRPAGTVAISGALITDEIWNDGMDDIAQALSDSAQRTEVAAGGSANVTTGSAPSYVLNLPTITSIGVATAFSFRPHVTNPGTTLGITGNLTNGLATISNVTIPAGIAAGQVVTSATSGIPAGATVLAFGITDTVTGKGNVTLSAVFTGTTTVSASISLAPINPTLTLSGVAAGTFTGPLANNTKRLIAPDGTGIKAGELSTARPYRAFFEVTRDAFVVLDLGRIGVDFADSRPGVLSEKFITAEGAALVVQTDPTTGAKKFILPGAGVQVGDIINSGRPGITDAGWLNCDGSSYLQSAQSALFSAIGHAFVNVTDLGTANSSLAVGAMSNADYFAAATKYVFAGLTSGTTQATLFVADAATPTTWSSAVTEANTNYSLTGAYAEGNGIYVALLKQNTLANYMSLRVATNGTGTGSGAPIPAGGSGTFSPDTLAYGAGLFVAIMAGSQSSRTSPDAVTWTPRTYTLTNQTGQSLVFGNSMFVCSGTDGTIVTSTDGLIFTAVTTTGLAAITDGKLEFSNGTFVYSGASTRTYYTSTDAITWKRRTLPGVAGPQAKACLNGVWMFSNSATTAVITYDFVTHRTVTVATGRASSVAASPTVFLTLSSVAAGQTGRFQISYTMATSFLVPDIAPNPANFYIKSGA